MSFVKINDQKDEPFEIYKCLICDNTVVLGMSCNIHKLYCNKCGQKFKISRNHFNPKWKRRHSWDKSLMIGFFAMFDRNIDLIEQNKDYIIQSIISHYRNTWDIKTGKLINNLRD